MKKVPLGEICRFEYGKNLPDKSREKGLATVYGSNGPVGFHRKGFTQGKTIVIGRKGSIGAVHLSETSCWPIDTTYYIDASCTGCDLDWLSLGLKFLELGTLNKASGVPGLNRDDAYKQMLWVPKDKQDQILIAAQLKAQLAEVEKVRQALQIQWGEAQLLKSKALEAVFARASNWQPLGVAARVQSGYAFKSESFKRSGVRLLRNANILPGKVYWDDAVYLSEDDAEHHPNYVLQVGDVLISLDRPIISSGIKVARVQLNDLPALLLQRVGRFVLDPDKLDAGYLYAYLQTERFIAQISGHEQSLGVPHISPSQVEAALMPLPDLTFQKEMATRLTQITETWLDAVQALRKQREDLAALPQRLLAQAFNHREAT